MAGALRLGIDVGSTTVKAVVLEPESGRMLYRRYTRHFAEQAATAAKLLTDIAQKFPGRQFRTAVCGSGGKPIADAIGAHYIQEVVANAAAVRRLYPNTRTAIELGGQDAKIIFFYYDETKKCLLTSDMRMNGSCAGGTGAFIDEIASLLRIPAEEFEACAAKGTTVYDISGRCGVFAKTDIQSILNAGGRREDIALSAFHAIVKQTIGGLAQGLELKPPIIFEGGPLTFDPTLVRVFAERLGLSEQDIIRPKNPEIIVAQGAAMAIDELFPQENDCLAPKRAVDALHAYLHSLGTAQGEETPRYFSTSEECAQWRAAHAPAPLMPPHIEDNTLRVYLGIDAGSTTSKLVLMDENERVVDRFYSGNQGEPLRVVKRGLLSLYQKYADQGVRLEIIGLGTTGYGEMLFAKAFGADYHTVETVAHATAARKYVPDASFVLDIGGQDMKAIWLSDGIVTDITLNEACSSGCGSFLENFAASLGIPVTDIADAAFAAAHPAKLGSRCTVFMNSTIITEQKNGRQSGEIMAGLCRSIIENVFTKVVRISSPAALGDRIVVQGGTFQNDAVLRAMEQYVGRPVTRAPYPGEMGCIGAALLTKQHMQAAGGTHTQFIGFDALRDFSYTQRSNIRCGGCANDCALTRVSFSSGVSYVTGNRCPRGESEGGTPVSCGQSAPDLFLRREALLFCDYPFERVSAKKHITIGLPRTLEFWDSMPFWTTFFHALGFDTRLSHASTKAMYERGIPFVPSDTVCFPAKLAHGHIRDLIEQGVDRIFMPMVMEMPSDNVNKESNYVCAVVKGYPMMISHSENPERRWNVPFDHPMFHWYTERDREKQIIRYMKDTFGLPEKEIRLAIAQGAQAIDAFRGQLKREGAAILEQTRRDGTFAVVLAGRPYHTDPLVCHDLSRVFTRQGVAVLTVDALPDIGNVSLRYTRAEITNNFHTRMLSGAMLAAQSPELEYVQIVSFGCGHDAILSDEIIRIMRETAGKSPLILKLDEGAAENALAIRVKSFLETVTARRVRQGLYECRPLGDAYPTKYRREDWQGRTVLVPNVSAAFCKLLSAIISKVGLRAEPLSLGGIEEIQLGKQYVHNDTCFPAQMCIGEALAALKSGRYPRDAVAIGMAKYTGDCRLAHYSALLRRALDEAGYQDIPIMSTDPTDSKEMHPGLRLGNVFNVQALWAITMMDMLEELRRKIRPYELHEGETDRIFEQSIDAIAAGLTHSIAEGLAAYRKAIDRFCGIPYDRSQPRPRVFVTGEYLVTFHPGSNFRIERYLEKNGMEVILPRMAHVFRKDYIARQSEMREFGVHYPLGTAAFTYVGDELFDLTLHTCERAAKKHPLYTPVMPFHQLADQTDPVISRRFTSGEGWLIAAEILEYARDGVGAFVILQPFGCLPNHVCGRGIMKRIKEDFPAIQLLPIDLEPDTSFANVENRLQMLIMNEKSRHAPQYTAQPQPFPQEQTEKAAARGA